MPKLITALLAVPVLLVVYVASLLRGWGIVRSATALGLGIVLGMSVVAFVRPAPTTATLPTDIVPLTSGEFRTVVGTDAGLRQPATIEFSTPMDRLSVADSISISPPSAVDLRWDEASTAVMIVPATRWQVDTYYTITVEPGALAETGRPMTRPVRAAFLTRGATTAAVQATERVGDLAAVDTAFSIVSDRPIDPATLAGAVRVEPALTGAIEVVTDVDSPDQYRFVPTSPLQPGTAYSVVVEGLADADGVPIAPVNVTITTVEAPDVVRFRPRDKSTDAERADDLSVRFTTPMDRASTAAAFSATVDGEPIAGTASWAEDDTVLVFDTKSVLPWDKVVTMTVSATATSAIGVALEAPVTATFRVEAEPPPPPPPASTGGGSSGGGGSTGGGSTGSGSWSAVERYYLNLMNCTRTGGWVQSDGDCSSPGGRNVAPLALDSGITTKVARPYAKMLATTNQCSHFIGGNPGDRLRRAGYTNYTWAENLGCRSGNPYGAVLGSHLYFQSEKSYLGGHYVNMMNAKYDRAGIGVWVSSGRVRLVVDFYHP